jgi:hypothetical protein
VRLDQYAQVAISEQEAFEALYTKKLETLEGIYIDGNIETFNTAIDTNADKISLLKRLESLDITVAEFDKNNQSQWYMPDDYCPDLMEFLYGCCTTEEQTNRVSQELELFIQHGMLDLLYYLKYLVDTMRQNKILWGVGRGSSVASYVLFLIGIHKIDSIKYNLDIKEFLK